MKRIRIEAARAPYEVLVGEDLTRRAGELLGDLLEGRRCAVVTDAHVAERWGRPLEASLPGPPPFLVLPPGEGSKTFAGLETLLDQLLALNLGRGDLVLAFGGGVVGDLAGFAAAVYKRGVDFVQIPTTLLAQIDSSVGGKTGIDTSRGKNLVGAFHAPRRVLADLSVLRTLPAREIRCGLAEALKYGLLGDETFFGWQEDHLEDLLSLRGDPLARLVARCVEMKAEIVGEDERETGRRALLNLGHTFGHAFEAETGFSGRLQHGEAVAAGMAFAFRFSGAIGFGRAEDAPRVEAALRRAGLPTRLGEIWPTAAPAADRLIDHMAHDKKVSGSGLTLVLPRRIGAAELVRGIDPSRMRRFLVAEGCA